MESALKKMNISHLHIFRPSLILGKRQEFRFWERLSMILFKTFGFLIPAKYKGIEASIIAKAMLNVAKGNYRQTIFLSDEIKNLGKSNL